MGRSWRTTAAEPAIRPYREGDDTDVARLLTVLEDPLVETPSLDRWRHFVAMSFNRGGRDFAVAEIHGELVGILTSTRLPAEPSDLRHFRIVVDPGWQRQQLGSRLLDLVRHQDRDATTLQCNVYRSWKAGTAFLEYHGFKTARREMIMRRKGPSPTAERPAGIAIRPFGARDDPAVWSALHDRGYRGEPDFVPLNIPDADMVWREPGFRFWFAELDGVPIGFCHASEAGSGRARIESLVVDPDHHGRGLGRTLLTVALAALAETGCGSVALGVRADNEPAVGLYKSLGFATVDEMVTWRRTKTRG